MRNRMLAVALVLVAGGLASAEDTVDNPEFTSWSKFPKGTTVTMKSSTMVGGNASEISMTHTLVEVGADKVVVETVGIVKVNGMELKAPATKRDVTKTVPLPKGVKKEDFLSGKPAGTTEEGTETLKVGGMELKTKWYRSKAEMNGMTVESKTWISDAVPGWMVKMEASITGKIATTTKLEVVEFKKP